MKYKMLLVLLRCNIAILLLVIFSCNVDPPSIKAFIGAEDDVQPFILKWGDKYLCKSSTDSFFSQEKLMLGKGNHVLDSLQYKSFKFSRRIIKQFDSLYFSNNVSYDHSLGYVYDVVIKINTMKVYLYYPNRYKYKYFQVALEPEFVEIIQRFANENLKENKVLDIQGIPFQDVGSGFMVMGFKGNNHQIAYGNFGSIVLSMKLMDYTVQCAIHSHLWKSKKIEVRRNILSIVQPRDTFNYLVDHYHIGSKIIEKIPLPPVIK